MFKIIRYSWSLKRYYMPIATLVVIDALLNQVNPFLTKAIVDGLVRQTKGAQIGFGYFVTIIGLMLLIGVAGGLLSNVTGYLGDMLSAKLNTYLSSRYYKHVLSLPLQYFDNEIAGKITSRLERSITTITQLMQAFSNTFITMFLSTFITLIIVAYYAWPVALMLAALFPIYYGVTRLSSKSWQAQQEAINQHTDRANGRFVESIGQIRVVKSFVRELAEHHYFTGQREAIEQGTSTQSKRWHGYDIVRRLSLALIFASIYGYISYQAYRGHLSLGQFTLLTQLVLQAQFPLYSLSFIVDSIQRAEAGSKDFFQVMETRPQIIDRPDAKTLGVDQGEVRFQDVTFAYEGGQTVLQDLTFTLEPGKKLALVGESGQGKTTISNLLLRFYEPSAGSVTIDGIDISGVTQASLREAIGVVFQEPALFSGSIRDNIAYGVPGASKREVERAAAAANAADFIAKLPHGYDTEIGERGVKLSGGQKQRLAIARAILKNPPILILDEATSSLDSKAEHEVQQALEELMQGRTTLIIAHRLSTIASVDHIVALQDGRVAEEGSPKELAQANGIYAELLALQQPGTRNRAKLKRYDIAR